MSLEGREEIYRGETQHIWKKGRNRKKKMVGRELRQRMSREQREDKGKEMRERSDGIEERERSRDRV